MEESKIQKKQQEQLYLLEKCLMKWIKNLSMLEIIMDVQVEHKLHLIIIIFECVHNNLNLNLSL